MHSYIQKRNPTTVNHIIILRRFSFGSSILIVLQFLYTFFKQFFHRRLIIYFCRCVSYSLILINFSWQYSGRVNARQSSRSAPITEDLVILIFSYPILYTCDVYTVYTIHHTCRMRRLSIMSPRNHVPKQT